RRMIRPTPRMLNSTLHPSPLRPPGQPRSGHLIIDPPPRIVVKSPPPIRPPRIRTHPTRMQSPHHIHIPGLIEDTRQPLPLLRQKPRILTVVPPILQIRLRMRNIPIPTHHQIPPLRLHLRTTLNQIRKERLHETLLLLLTLGAHLTRRQIQTGHRHRPQPPLPTPPPPPHPDPPPPTPPPHLTPPPQPPPPPHRAHAANTAPPPHDPWPTQDTTAHATPAAQSPPQTTAPTPPASPANTPHRPRYRPTNPKTQDPCAQQPATH